MTQFPSNKTAQQNFAELSALSCVECGKRFTDEGFQYYSGIIDYGPAYFSDQGSLCSPKCSLDHYQKRIKDGAWK